MTLTTDERTRLDETIRIYAELHAQLNHDGRRLLERFDRLHGEALVNESDRVLAIAGRVCMQFEEPDLFRDIYAIALDGCKIAPGDELRFLRGEVRS